MAISNLRKARLITIGVSFLFTLGAFAMLAYMTQQRNYPSADSNGKVWEYATNACSTADYNVNGLKVVGTDGDATPSFVCPWGFWNLVIGYLGVIFGLGFLGSIVIRHWKVSLKLLRVSLLLGFIAAVLLILAFISLVTTIGNQVTWSDYTFGGFTSSSSAIDAGFNAGLMFVSFLTVLVLFVYEGWTYKTNANGLDSMNTIRGALI